MLECSNAFPLLIPVPCLDRRIIATGEDDAERWMHGQASNIVGVRFKSRNLLVRIVIEDTKLEVIGSSNEPVLSWDEAYATNGDFCNFKGFHDSACFMIVNVDAPVIQSGDEPRFGWVEIDGFDTV